MEAIYECVSGLDVHSKSVQACVRRLIGGGRTKQEVRTFGTMTRDLVMLADWLSEEGVTHVAMESTGVFWKPIYNILEGRCTVLLVNAHHVKHLPGRKTDVKDSQWLAQLLQCGLLQGSFIPERAQREWRELTRQRAQLVNQHSSVINRIHKTLEDANIKLGTVASNILGASGRDMLRALIEGCQTPTEMADLARRKLREKIPALQEALYGHVTDHHRWLLGELLDQVEDLERRIERFSRRIEELSGPFEDAIKKVDAIPGFDRRGAENVLAEIGVTMKQFPTGGHLAVWAGICPGNNKTGGKSKSGRTTKGNRWLRTALVQAAWAASHAKGSYFHAQFRRLVGRRGKKRALVAVAHSLLVVIHVLLSTGAEYEDLGADYFDRRDEDRIVRSHVNRLERLGYKVTLETYEEAA
jgi:transposase